MLLDWKNEHVGGCCSLALFSDRSLPNHNHACFLAPPFRRFWIKVNLIWEQTNSSLCNLALQNAPSPVLSESHSLRPGPCAAHDHAAHRGPEECPLDGPVDRHRPVKAPQPEESARRTHCGAEREPGIHSFNVRSLVCKHPPSAPLTSSSYRPCARAEHRHRAYQSMLPSPLSLSAPAQHLPHPSRRGAHMRNAARPWACSHSHRPRLLRRCRP